MTPPLHTAALQGSTPKPGHPLMELVYPLTELAAAVKGLQGVRVRRHRPRDCSQTDSVVADPRIRALVRWGRGASVRPSVYAYAYGSRAGR